jgi:hypothetical protein
MDNRNPLLEEKNEVDTMFTIDFKNALNIFAI